jgi:predicted Rossmann fold flavoprotein
MDFDVIVIGAGAAGLMCAAEAGQRGRRVLLVDHAKKIGERIRVSGGGKCNFTNRHATAERYLSQNPQFCRSALARFSPSDFIARVERHRIPYHEREHGQLFCDRSARDIVAMLRAGLDEGGVRLASPCRVRQTERLADSEEGDAPRFQVVTEQGTFRCCSLVVATGGLAAPELGASPYGYRVAEQFGLGVVPPAPALVPLVLAPETLTQLKPLSGVSFAAETRCRGSATGRFRDHVLLTHRGLSGPAILQVSTYWQMQQYRGGRTQGIEIDLLPDVDAGEWLAEQRRSRTLLPNLLAERLPRRMAHGWCALFGWHKPLGAFSTRERDAVARALKNWTLVPSGTLGYAQAEVTLGGIDTRGLSSKTMEAVSVPGLYFIGEVVDVTGWLGGYNLQWAWSSGWVAGQYA